MIKVFYLYAFYRIDCFAKKVNKRDSDHAFTAVVAITLLVSMNFLTICFFLAGIFNFKLNSIVGPLLIAIFGFFNYSMLMKNKKSEKIIKQFEEMETKRRRKFNLLFILYIIFTFFICGIMAYGAKHHLI